LSLPLFATCFELFSRCENLVKSADHIECLLRQVVNFAVKQCFESLYSVFQRYILTGCAGELLSNVEGLRKESLNLSALATVCLSASESSSIPRMAMMS